MNNNLPPGVSASSIPGNRREDADYERLACDISVLLCTEQKPIWDRLTDEEKDDLAFYLADLIMERRRAGYDEGFKQGRIDASDR